MMQKNIKILFAIITLSMFSNSYANQQNEEYGLNDLHKAVQENSNNISNMINSINNLIK